MLSIFSCVCWPSVCLLWRNVCLVLWPIFWVGHLFFWSWAGGVACIFLRLILCGDMNFFLYHYWQENIVFKYTYYLKFNWVPFVYFCFISITLGGGSKEIFLGFMSKSVLPTFSSKSFIVSCLTLRSLIHFEFTFVYGVRDCSNFIVLHVAVQFSQHYLLKRLPFLHCIFLPPLS